MADAVPGPGAVSRPIPCSRVYWWQRTQVTMISTYAPVAALTSFALAFSITSSADRWKWLAWFSYAGVLTALRS